MLQCNFPSASRLHRMPTLVSPVCRAIQYCTKNAKQWQCCTVYNSWDIKMSFIAFWQCLETFQRLFNSILLHWLNWTVGDWLESNNRHLGGVSTFAEARGGRGGGYLEQHLHYCPTWFDFCQYKKIKSWNVTEYSNAGKRPRLYHHDQHGLLWEIVIYCNRCFVISIAIMSFYCQYQWWCLTSSFCHLNRLQIKVLPY